MRRIRETRGLTLDQLVARVRAAQGGLGRQLTKGHLSDLERGLSVPNVATLQAIAAQLACPMLDLVTFPTESSRQQLVALTRDLPEPEIDRMLRELRERRALRSLDEAE